MQRTSWVPSRAALARVLAGLCSVVAVVLGQTPEALAQNFTQTYRNLGCIDTTQVDDAQNDEGGNYLDLQQNGSNKGLAYAEDGTYVYFRFNVMQTVKGAGYGGNNDCSGATPSPANNRFRSFGWGVLLDFDNDKSDYEVAVALGWTGTVGRKLVVYSNATMSTDLASEPPDTKVKDTYDVCTHTMAQDSGSDHFLYVAVPLADLLTAANAVVTPDLTSIQGKFTVWGGTSNNGSDLNQDNTCSAIAASPKLSDSASEPILISR